MQSLVGSLKKAETQMTGTATILPEVMNYAEKMLCNLPTRHAQTK